MKPSQQTSIGILLCMIAFIFYGQTSLLSDYRHAHRNDFAHLYLAGYLAERGGNFFDAQRMLNTHRFLEIPTGLNPFVYPPFFAILLIPLSHFTYDTAWLFFSLLSHAVYFASLAVLIRLVRKEEDPPMFWWGIMMALSACFFPLHKTYTAGQMNTFMLFIISSTAYLFQKQRDTEAGVLLGLGASIKIAPAFLLIYCLWTQRWRALISGGVTILLCLLISFTYLGWDIHKDFLSQVYDMGYGSSTWSDLKQTYHIDPFNQAPSALWYRLFTTHEAYGYGTIEGIFQAPFLAKILSYATAISVLLFLLRFTKRMSTSFSEIDYAFWSLGMLLLPSLLWDHYLVQAIFAIAIAFRIVMTGQARAVVLLGMAIAFMSIPYHPMYFTGIANVLLSIKLFALLMLAGFLFVNKENIPSIHDPLGPGNS